MRWRSNAPHRTSTSHTPSTAGHSHISYNADDAALFGAVSHWPAASHPPGAMREIYSWDLGIKLGEIPQPPKTYNVMGNANEQGLAIGETTHGGLSVLSNVGKTAANGTIMDYNNLISVTLQRASTAREAIKTMAWLANTYGYASDMEGFSIADSDEVWYMELIGKGSFEKGVVWVALRVPDGYVSAHANQARITTFLPCDDPSACMAAPDAASFAIKHGLWSGKPDDPAFSFSDVYDPLTFEGLRFCEARVWYIFSQIADPSHFDAQAFLPYARGANASARMPLFVKPKAKLSRHRIHELMGSHYEGSWFDPSKDVGAGAEHTPYRWNGLSWEYQNTTYVNERVVGTQYTAWHFVARVASKAVPSPMRAVLWWGADDHSYSPKIPIHGGATAIHRSYDDHNCTGRSLCRAAAGLPGTVTELSFDSAWWVNNLVSDVVYTRKDRAAPVVLAARAALDHDLEQALAAAETAATKQFAAGDRDGGGGDADGARGGGGRGGDVGVDEAVAEPDGRVHRRPRHQARQDRPHLRLHEGGDRVWRRVEGEGDRRHRRPLPRARDGAARRADGRPRRRRRRRGRRPARAALPRRAGAAAPQPLEARARARQDEGGGGRGGVAQSTYVKMCVTRVSCDEFRL